MVGGRYASSHGMPAVNGTVFDRNHVGRNERPPLEHCPICRTAMIAEQTKDIPRQHNYECLWCGLTIRYTLPKRG